MKSTEKVVTTYYNEDESPTKYYVTQDVINHKFTLWKDKEKIKIDTLPYDFDNIVFPKRKGK